MTIAGFTDASERPLGSPDGVSLLVAHFVRRWDDALADANVRRVEPSAANLLSSLHVEVQDWLPRHTNPVFRKSGDGLHASLADLLDKALQQPDAGIALLRRLRPNETAVLQTLVSAATIDGRAVVAALAPLVAMIDAPMAAVADILGDTLPRLGAELAANGSCDSDDLDSAAVLGSRALLVYDRPDALKSWLKRWLSVGSAKVIVAECASGLGADESIARSANIAFREVAARLRAVDIEKRFAAAPDGPPSYGQLWRASAALVDARGDFDRALHSFASDIVAGFASQAVQSPLVAVFNETEKDVRAVWDALDALTTVFGDWFAARGWIHQPQGHPPWGGLVRDAIRAEVARAITEPIVPVVLAVRQDAVEALGAWLRAGVDSTSTADDKERMWYLASREVQSGISTFMASIQSTLSVSVTERIASLARDAAASFTFVELPKKIVEFAASSTDAWDGVRWGSLSESQLRQALGDVRVAFGSSRSFDVVIPVTGASIEPTSWRSGLLTWYTPATHSLGEAAQMPADESRKTNLHVWLRVEAPGVEAAHERAQVILEPALSALTFALSSSERVTGFRPGADVWFSHGSVADGSGGWHASRHRTEFADRKVSAKALQDFSIAYAPLIERAAGLGQQTDVESRLLRAMFWYRSGRWQRNPARRFLDHFVALEHLFTAGARNKDEAVADGVAAVEGSWLYRGFPFSAQIAQTAEVARKLSSDARSNVDVGNAADRVANEGRSVCVNAAHWRTHLFPWLSPSFVGAVASLLPQQPPPAQWPAHVAGLMKEQANETSWTQSDAERASAAWFKMRLLAQRRHDIVHQALTHVPGIEYEADSLTDVVETVLRHLVEDTLNRPNAATTMRDVLDNLVPPWLS
jgi:hypothetical protein